MADGSLARRYARAMISLAQEIGHTDLFAMQLESFLTVVQQDGGLLGSVLGNPGLTTIERRAILDRVLERMSLHPHVASFLKLLVDKNRFGHLDEILPAYLDMADDLSGRARATVTTARPLSPAMAEQVKASLQASTGRTVILTQKVDARIIGGMVVRLGDTIYDTSIRARLDSVEAALLRSAAQA